MGYREHLKTFLKGSKKKKKRFYIKDTQNCINYLRTFGNCGSSTWSRATLHLCCCFRHACTHPLCQQNVQSFLHLSYKKSIPSSTIRYFLSMYVHCTIFSIGNYNWYEGGPSVDNLLLPVPDLKRPWGDTNCHDYKGTCTGHYLKPAEILNSSHQTFSLPPSVANQKFQAIKFSWHNRFGKPNFVTSRRN